MYFEKGEIFCMQNNGNKAGHADWEDDPNIMQFVKQRARSDAKDIDGMTAKELEQEYFETVDKAWPQYDTTLGVKKITFLHTCLLNTKRQLIRKRMTAKYRNERYAPSLDASVEEGGIPEDKLPSGTDESPESILEAKEIRDIALRELNKLKPRDQEIVLKVVSGYSQVLVAKLYGVKQPAVAAVMRRYREMVRIALLNAGYNPPAA